MRRTPAIIRIIGYFFSIGSVFYVALSAGIAFFLLHYSKDLPDYASLRTCARLTKADGGDAAPDEKAKCYEPPVMTRLYAADGQLLAEYAKERRLYLPIQSIPERLIKAFLSAEDKNYYDHRGIDYTGVGRAILNNAEQKIAGNKSAPQGASTITQQVAKNFLLTNERTMDRKVKEALISLKIERAFTKDQILELYLNEIYLGLGSYGVAAAALVYFDKSVQDLTVAECAYLAALPKAPNNYHPFRQRERATDRRNWVIGQMAENGVITPEEAIDAKAEPLTVTKRSTGALIYAADFFAEEVRRKIYEQYNEKTLYEGGLSVRTTLDPKLQAMLRRSLADGLIAYDQKTGWRGPVSTLDVSGDWGLKLAGVTALGDVDPWRLAVVLALSPTEAQVGLQPQKLPSGELAETRERGVIAMDNMRWAKWSTGDKRGKPMKTPGDTLSIGDVVYVEPTAKGDAYALRQPPEVQGGAVAMDPHTGRVLAMVGGFSFFESEFNRATQAQRQPGSSFKPFVYAAALDGGYTPSSVVLDAPFEIKSGDEMWRPENYSGEFYGPSTLRVGIEKSRNLMTVRLAEDLGMLNVARYAKKFGVYDALPHYLSASLGSVETTVMKMTSAYSMLANGGKQVKPTLIDRIQDRYGRTVYKHDDRKCKACNVGEWSGQDEPVLKDERESVIDPMTAYQMVSMLEGVVLRGTGTKIAVLRKPLAGKTGTTNDEKDAWFVGFSPDLAMGVYIGYDKPRAMGKGSTGGDLAAPVFRDFMKLALADKAPVPFRVPTGMHTVRINAKTGLRAGPGETAGVLVEAFKRGTNPPDAYSVIGYTDQMGKPQAVTPESDRAARMGTGGLY